MFVSFPLWAFRLEMWNDHHALGMSFGVWLSSIRALGYDFVGNLFYITLGINEWCTGFEKSKKIVKILAKYHLWWWLKRNQFSIIDWMKNRSKINEIDNISRNCRYFNEIIVCEDTRVKEEESQTIIKKSSIYHQFFNNSFFFQMDFLVFFQKSHLKKNYPCFFHYFFPIYLILNLYHTLFYIILLFLIIFINHI